MPGAIGHVPEDRQDEGLIMPFEAWENIAFGVSQGPEIQFGDADEPTPRSKADCVDKMGRYDVRPAQSAPARAQLFPAGNQQKIVVAPRDGPRPRPAAGGPSPRAVSDIGAIEVIHKQIIALRDQVARRSCLFSVELDGDHGPERPHRRDVRRQVRASVCPPRPTRTSLGLLMAGVSEHQGRGGRLMDKMPKWADVILIPLISVVLALVVSGLVVALIGESPLARGCRVMVQGGFGSA